MPIIIILTILSIGLGILSLYLFKTRKNINNEVENENNKINSQNQELKEKLNKLYQEYEQINDNLLKINKEINNVIVEKDRLIIERERESAILEQIRLALKEQQKDANSAFENYCDILDKSYTTKETQLKQEFVSYCLLLEKDFEEKNKDYDILLSQLKNNYDKEQDKLIENNNKLIETLKIEKEAAAAAYECEKAVIEDELNQLRATKEAAMKAFLREEEVKKHKEFHSVQPTESDFKDIQLLEKIIPELRNQRTILKVIWQEYYQKSTQEMCKRILKTTNKVCGIYKIKNQVNGLCYVGQAKNIDERWKTHMKCGLGVETEGQGKKLHEAMKKYGVHNFTFEVLEECPEEMLNEKEAFYIEIEQAYTCGYNLTKGNNKK